MQQGGPPVPRLVHQRRGFPPYQLGSHSFQRPPPRAVPMVVQTRTSLAVKELAARAFRQPQENSGPLNKDVVQYSPCNSDPQRTMAESSFGANHFGEDYAASAPLSEPPYPTTTDLRRSGTEGGLHVLSNSTNARVRCMTVNNAQRDIVQNVKRGMDEVELGGILRDIFGPETLPMSLGYSLANGLVLTDALGETITLPWTLVPTYGHLERQLLLHFNGKVGERYVSEGRFSITRAGGAGGGEVIAPDNWENFVGRRERVVMSMLIEQILKTEDLRRTCPKCGPTDLGIFEHQGWYICRRCNLRFIVSTEKEHKDRVERGEANDEAYFRHVQKMEREQAKEKEPPVARELDFTFDDGTFFAASKFPPFPVTLTDTHTLGFPLQGLDTKALKRTVPKSAAFVQQEEVQGRQSGSSNQSSTFYAGSSAATGPSTTRRWFKFPGFGKSKTRD